MQFARPVLRQVLETDPRSSRCCVNMAHSQNIERLAPQKWLANYHVTDFLVYRDVSRQSNAKKKGKRGKKTSNVVAAALPRAMFYIRTSFCTFTCWQPWSTMKQSFVLLKNQMYPPLILMSCSLWLEKMGVDKEVLFSAVDCLRTTLVSIHRFLYAVKVSFPWPHLTLKSHLGKGCVCTVCSWHLKKNCSPWRKLDSKIISNVVHVVSVVGHSKTTALRGKRFNYCYCAARLSDNPTQHPTLPLRCLVSCQIYSIKITTTSFTTTNKDFVDDNVNNLGLYLFTTINR